MAHYRTLPVVIQAWPAKDLIAAAAAGWDAAGWDVLPAPVLASYKLGGWIFTDRTIQIPTLDGTMIADASDMIVRGIEGEFYPCKADIFAKTYEHTGHFN